MFTGLVVAQGKVKRIRDRAGGMELEIEAPKVARELDAGDSVAVNGACLTATSAGRRRFLVELMPETVARSTFARIERGANVNLELPLRLSERLGGHLVQGHVDGVARVVRSEEDDGARRVWLSADEDIVRYVVGKGSVSLDGVSLTVVEAGRSTFQVALIPHTLGATTLGRLEVGSEVNVEVDILAKYVERFTSRATIAGAHGGEGR
jgi:riboflavin synthase